MGLFSKLSQLSNLMFIDETIKNRDLVGTIIGFEALERNLQKEEEKRLRKEIEKENLCNTFFNDTSDTISEKSEEKVKAKRKQKLIMGKLSIYLKAYI